MTLNGKYKKVHRQQSTQVGRGDVQTAKKCGTGRAVRVVTAVDDEFNGPVRCAPPTRMRPPPPRQESWADRLQTCQDGSWWLVRTYSLQRSATVIASHLRAGVKLTPPGRWHFITGRTEDGRYAIWARRTDVVGGSGKVQRRRLGGQQAPPVHMDI